MTETPRISCIIPVFNCERYIGESLDSVLAQTCPVSEILVVDDGSTDGTAAVVAGYEDRGVRYVRQENMGPAAARNRGVAGTGGGFVAFLDADDLWAPDKLERQVARFRERPELGFVITHFTSFWTPDLKEEEDSYQDPRTARVLPGYLMQTMLVRRDVLESVGPLEESLMSGEDQDWFLRAEDLGVAMEVLPEILLQRRLHPDNMTRRLGQEVQRNLLRVVRRSMARRRSGSRTESETP